MDHDNLVWAKLNDGDNSLDFARERTTRLGGEDRLTQLGVFLYYYAQWRLILYYDLFVKGTGVIGHPGYVNGYRINATAFYTSSENDCFFSSPHFFTHQSDTSSLTISISDKGGTDPSVGQRLKAMNALKEHSS